MLRQESKSDSCVVNQLWVFRCSARLLQSAVTVVSETLSSVEGCQPNHYKSWLANFLPSYPGCLFVHFNKRPGYECG